MSGPGNVNTSSLFRVTTKEAYTEGVGKFKDVTTGEPQAKVHVAPPDFNINVGGKPLTERNVEEKKGDRQVSNNIKFILEEANIDEAQIDLILSDLGIGSDTQTVPKDFAQKLLSSDRLTADLKKELVDQFKTDIEMHGFEGRLAGKLIETMSSVKGHGDVQLLSKQDAQELFTQLTQGDTKLTKESGMSTVKTNINQHFSDKKVDQDSVTNPIRQALTPFLEKEISNLKTEIPKDDQVITLNLENREALAEIFKDPEIATLLASIQRGDDKLIGKSSFKVNDALIETIFAQKEFQEFMIDFGKDLMNSAEFQKAMRDGLDENGQLKPGFQDDAKKMVMQKMMDMITTIKEKAALDKKDLKKMSSEEIEAHLKKNQLTKGQRAFVTALLTAKDKGDMFATRNLFKGFIYRTMSGLTFGLKSGSVAYKIALTTVGILAIGGFVAVNVLTAGLPLYLTIAGAGTLALAGFVRGFYVKHRYDREKAVDKARMTTKEKWKGRQSKVADLFRTEEGVGKVGSVVSKLSTSIKAKK